MLLPLCTKCISVTILNNSCIHNETAFKVLYNIHFRECRFAFWSRNDKGENSASTLRYDIPVVLVKLQNYTQRLKVKTQLYYIILHFTTLYYNILYYIILYYTIV
jgi:hypothetical protein